MEKRKISKEQLCKILHISKRKAVWMLENGIIPCENRNTPTHKYQIELTDVEAYLELSNGRRRMQIPIGLFNAKPTETELHPELYLKLRGAERKRFIEYLEKVLSDVPDSLTIDQAADAIGYSRNMVFHHVSKGNIAAVKLYGKYIIPKTKLIAYLATDKAFKIQRKSKWHIERIETYITNK